MIHSLVYGKIGMELAIAVCQVRVAAKVVLHLHQNRPHLRLRQNRLRRVLVFHPAQAQVLLKGKL